MPNGTTVDQRQSLPVSRSYIAEALAAQRVYAEELDEWYDWLEDPAEPPNADKLVLFKLITDTIRRREAGGEWEDVDEDLIPSADDLRGLLDTVKFNKFKLEVESRRKPVEDAALKLVTILKSEALLNELHRLPWDNQLEYCGQMLDQLAVSNVGLRYQRECLYAAPESPLPVAHVERLRQEPGSFINTEAMVLRRASRFLAEYFLKLVPALISDVDYTKFLDATYEVLVKYFQTNGRSDTDLVLDVLTFEDKLDNLRLFHKNNPQHILEFGKQVAASIYLVFEIANVYRAVLALKQDPSVRSKFALLRAVAGLTSALSSAQQVLRLPTALKLSTSRMVGLNILIAIYDLAIGAIDAHEAWRTGDLSVAAGQVLQGVGLAGAAVASTWTALSVAGALSPSAAVNPVGGVLLTLGAILVTFTGTLLITYTQDPPMDQWFENNFFGSNWDDVEADESPGGILFMFKRVDDTPDIGRQVSAFLSMLYPIGLTAELGQIATKSVAVTLMPQLAYHESHIFVKRIADAGLFADPPRYTLVPLYMKPANVIADNVTFYSPTDPEDDENLMDWIRTFSPLELSQGMNPNYDAAGAYLEVDITIPDKFAPALANAIGTNPELMNNFAFVLRARALVG